MADYQQPPPAPGTAGGGGAAMSMEELLQKERELALQAAELAKRDREVRLALQKMQPNWPRKCCCISPVVYHSIISEVPTDRVSFVTTCYYCYYFTAVMLIYNCTCALVAFTAKPQDGSTSNSPYMSHFIVSCFHLIGCIFAFFVWYFPIYQACSTYEAGKYKMAYLGLAVALIYDIFMAIGVVGYGGCGWLFLNDVKNNKQGSAPLWMSVVMAVLWTLQIFFFVWVIFRMRRYNRIDRNRTLADRAKNAIASAVGVALP